MSVLADGYSSYLTYTFDYVKKMLFFDRIFSEGYSICRESSFLTKDFIAKLDNFPLFPYFYNILSADDSINVIKIYNVTSDNVEDLETALISKPEVIRQKAVYDLIPLEKDNIEKYATFQYAYMSGISDLYNKELNFRSFMFDRSYRNFFSSLYADNFCSVGESESAGLENSCCIHLYSIQSYLFNLITSSCNLSSKLLLYLIYFNTYGSSGSRVNNSVLIDSFSSFITSYKNTMSDELIDLVCRSIYGFINVNDLLREQIAVIVKTKLSELSTILSSYLTSVSNNPVYSLSAISTNLLYHIISCNILSKIYNDNTILTQVEVSKYAQVESDTFDNYLAKITTANIEAYLFISYLYKFQHHRFMNILPLCMKEYTENVIKPSGVDTFTLSQFLDIVDKLYDSAPVSDPAHPGEYLFPQSILNYNTLRTYLVNTVKLSPVNYLSQISNAYQVPRFACIIYYLELLDSFFQSTTYETFVRELLEDIFIYLRNNGHVDYDFNWYDYHEVVDIYLKVYMRYKLINSDSGDCLFQTFTDNFTTLFNRVITNTTHSFDPFPPAGSYDISIDFPTAYDMNTMFSNMLSGTTKERMLQFIENMILSVLTREIIYGAFSYFIV